MKVSQLVAATALVASSVALPASGAVSSLGQEDQESRSPLYYPSGLRQQQQQDPITRFRPYHTHHDGGGDDSFEEDHEASSFPLIDQSLEYIRTGLRTTLDAAEDIQDKLHGYLSKAVDALPPGISQLRPDSGDHDFPDLTIYQLIGLSNYTTKLHKLVSEYPDLVDALNSTDAKYTLFAPIDSAFDGIPDHHHHDGDDDDDGDKKRQFIESVLKYHVGLDVYNVRTLLTTRTLPTALKEKHLGDEAQRLRASVGLGGVRLNFYSRIVAGNIGASNGIIHGVDKILVPPPSVGRLVSLFPGHFSTLLLAFEKTDFADFIHNVTTVGGTLFAPDNHAFTRLGPRANAFLFNTDKGLKYLSALLKYHIAPNATLYSDEFYDERGKSGKQEPVTLGREHFDLDTFLGDAHVGVDIATLGVFRSIRVNGFSYVTIADGIGKDGVVQVIDKVLVPPYKHKQDSGNESMDGPIEVDELIERLSGYVE